MRKWLKKFLYNTSRRAGTSVENSLDRLVYLMRSSRFFHSSNVELSKNRMEMFDRIIRTQQLEGQQLTYLEFGVWRGESLKYWAGMNKNSSSAFVGFDTFEGLPEAWGVLPKGHFSTNGATPDINDSRVAFQKGLFQNTLPQYIESNKALFNGAGRKVIHLDADLYSSTLYVLVELYPYLKAGDIVLFDELFTLRNNAEEFRALLDFLAIRNFKYKAIGKTDKQFALQCE